MLWRLVTDPGRVRAGPRYCVLRAALEIYNLRVDRLLVGFEEPNNKVNGIVQ